MKLDRFKRIEPAEIVLHWLQAIPFLVLLVSGALMLLVRHEFLSADLLETFVTIHKWVALGWCLALILTLFTNSPVTHFQNFKEAFTWRKSDFVWLAAPFIRFFRPQFPLPESGKFNAGQKMLFLGTVFLTCGLALSGALIWQYNTVLMFWYIHLALFVLSILLVLGHLYMAMVNPSTRIGLFGVFHGWVPKEYIEEHHALLLPENERKLRKPGKKLTRTMLLARLGLLLLIALGLLRVGYYNRYQLITAPKYIDKALLPGPLFAQHAEKTSDDCYHCHSLLQEIADADCLSCHEKIALRLEKKEGYHGQFGGNCIECHTEHLGKAGKIHPLNLESFSHSQALFDLNGEHRALECSACHQPGQEPFHFIGLAHSSCLDCHEDAHDKQYRMECSACHSAMGWHDKNVTFDHSSDTNYPLEGKHLGLTCEQCHSTLSQFEASGNKFSDQGNKSCLVCHDDPHRSALGSDCQTCHTPFGWQGRELVFDHSKHSSFKIDALHSTVSCAQCHPQSQYKINKSTCVDCHGEYQQMLAGRVGRLVGQPDAHNKLVSCVECHDTKQTSQTDSSYANNCVRCHHGSYRSLYLDWKNLLWSRRAKIESLLEKHAANKSLSKTRLNKYREELSEINRVGAHNYRIADRAFSALARKLSDENVKIKDK